MLSYEIDHLFVLSRPGAPEADELLAAGFREGAPNVHAGQGTACRRFFFSNAMLEFLHVTELEVLEHGAAARTGLGLRWANAGGAASPFGICLRPAADKQLPAPFPSWTYGPAYLPDGTPSYQISSRCALVAEPFAFYMPRGASPSQAAPGPPQVLQPAGGAQVLTSVSLESPGGVPDLRQPGIAQLQIRQSNRHHLHVTFDSGRQGASLRLESLRLSLEW